MLIPNKNKINQHVYWSEWMKQNNKKKLFKKQHRGIYKVGELYLPVPLQYRKWMSLSLHRIPLTTKIFSLALMNSFLFNEWATVFRLNRCFWRLIYIYGISECWMCFCYIYLFSALLLLERQSICSSNN